MLKFTRKLFFLVYSIKRRDFNTSDTKDKKFDDSKIATTTTTFNTMTTQNSSPKTPVDGIGPTTHEGMPTSLRSVNMQNLIFC